MRIAIAQYNPTVGDLRGNMERLLAAAANAVEADADLLVAPELALTGYPPKDFLDRPGFVQECLHTLSTLIRQAPLPMLVGAVVSAKGDPTARTGHIANGAVLARAGEVLACHRKNLLPSYDVFDETRYFSPGTEADCVTLGGVRVGISVCEDLWNDKDYWQYRRYDTDPVTEQVERGAELLINLSASPYDRNKPDDRLAMLQALVRRHQRPILYVNQIGGNDSLLFDGRSLALAANGDTTLRAAAFREELALGTFKSGRLTGEINAEPSCWEEDVTDALCMGLRDYLRKTGFDKVILGLSGGIDSALVAALAVRALGPSRVLGLALPSAYSSEGSVTDARELARRLGIRCDVIPIHPMVTGFETALKPLFADLQADVTEENLQARIRGTVLMAHSNKFGAMLLTTGNKSEVAMGYCTLYGDMNGGLGPISDLYKTEVYALSRYINASAENPVIPENSLLKPPSAELRPGQTDQDSLPPYELLDAVLKGYIEEAADYRLLVARGHPAEVVQRVAGMVDRTEYKRRQMAPGLRVSRKAFGEGRRFPIAHRLSV